MALKLIGEVALDGSGWERGLSRMASSVKSFVAGAFGFYAVTSAIRKTADVAGELADASQRLGINPEKLQVFKQAAKEAGASLETLVKGFEKVGLAQDAALSGDDKKLEAFKKLGISLEMLGSMSREDLFAGPIAATVKRMNPSDIATPMKEIFSKSYGEFIGPLKTDFGELESSMRKMGAIMDTETVAALDILGDQFSILANIIAAQLGPKLIAFAELVYKMGAGLAASWAWLSSHFSSGAKEMGEVMSATPGYGGWSSGQQSRFEAIKPMSEEEKAAKNEAAKAAALKVFTSWMGELDAIKAKFAEAADKLRNPIRARTDRDDQDESKAPKVKLAKEHGGDALVRVGNFLGGSRDVMTDIATRQLNYLGQIANNTRQLASQSSGAGGDFPPV